MRHVRAPGRIDTLWVGLQPRDWLTSLHARVDAALRVAGVAPDARAFLPHVTLARFGRTAAPTEDVAMRVAPLPVGSFTLDRFALYESRLGADGATYEPVAHYRLDAVV